jgi:MoaA/NifB/PqqE/SkfB family radical SAM enzyme
MLAFARDAGIEYTRTGTNGFMFMNSDSGDFEKRIAKIAEALAATKIRNFWISIDSADPALHEAMRGLPGVIKGIEKALPIFNQYGIYPSANLGISRKYRRRA